jgi:predicted nucleic acid-binding protein
MTMEHDIRFYDTSALLALGEQMPEEKIMISSITLNELERIKVSSTKDSDTKYLARQILKWLRENIELYDLIIHTENMENTIREKFLTITDDTRILSDAIYANNFIHPDKVIFVTNDFSLANIA